MKKAVKKYKDGGAKDPRKKGEKRPLTSSEILKMQKQNPYIKQAIVKKYKTKEPDRVLGGSTLDTVAAINMGMPLKHFDVEKKNGYITGKRKSAQTKNPDDFMRKGGKLHLGFKEAQAKIAKKQGISMEAAGAILASSARKASPAAVKKNPALLNVKRGKVKKYGDGGKTKKGIYKGVEYNSKGDIISKYDVSSKKGDRNQYSVYADGKPVKHTYNPTTNVSRRAELDTIGYSKGKQSFTKTVELKKGNGKIVKTKTKVPRKSVLNQIKSMQTMRKGGKK